VVQAEVFEGQAPRFGACSVASVLGELAGVAHLVDEVDRRRAPGWPRTVSRDRAERPTGITR
jgi:hypothetical protein